MAGPHSVDDMENIKSLDDIKRSPECTYVSILSKMIVMHILHILYVIMYVCMYVYVTILLSMIIYIYTRAV